MGEGSGISPPEGASAVSRGVPPLRRPGHVAGPVERGADQPRLFVLQVPEVRPGGQQLQKTIRTTSSASAGEDRRVMAIRSSMGLYAATVPADGFVGTKRSQGPQLLSPITRTSLP